MHKDKIVHFMNLMENQYKHLRKEIVFFIFTTNLHYILSYTNPFSFT